MTLDEVNALTPAAFVTEFGGIYEHSPWIAEKAEKKRPFSSLSAMEAAFASILKQADHSVKHALVCAHPELGHRAGIDPALSEDSAQEQGGAGLDRLTAEEYERFHALNAAYRAKFDMPFVICVRKAGKAPKAIILEEMSRRLNSTAANELTEALAQIDAIASLRLQDKVKV